jgi:hypothetical protein
MIPDDRHWSPVGVVTFRDADGCAVFPGGETWVSEREWLGVDSRTLHIPVSLGDVEQFELSRDCHVLDSGFDLDEEEELYEAMLLDPLVREVAQIALDSMPAAGGEIAFETGRTLEEFA